jgi:hypothetical protein
LPDKGTKVKAEAENKKTPKKQRNAAAEVADLTQDAEGVRKPAAEAPPEPEPETDPAVLLARRLDASSGEQMEIAGLIRTVPLEILRRIVAGIQPELRQSRLDNHDADFVARNVNTMNRGMLNRIIHLKYSIRK